MNRLLRRFGVRSWDAAVFARSDTDLASALSGAETGPVPIARFTPDSAEGTPSGADRRSALSRSGTDSARRQPSGAADRRWAAIGRGTADFVSGDGYGRTTSSEASR